MATQVSLNSGAVASAGALALQTNGTTEAVSISTGQVATLAQNPILTSGTANGVAYLNGSKAVTSGSALTFDGTNFATTGTASATKMIPTGGSATGNGMYLPASNTLAWSNNGSETMRLDSTGNLGLGVTPVASVYTASRNLFVGQGSNLTGRTTINFTSLNTNSYEYPTTSAATFINSSSAAAQYYQYLGAHYWQSSTNTPTANSSITWNAAMTLDASGNLGVGNTSPGSFARLTVQDSGSGAGTLALISSAASNAIYIKNTGTSADFKYNDAYPMTWSINGTERMRLDSSGNLGLGSTSPINTAGYTGLTINNATNGGLISFATGNTQKGSVFNAGNNMYIDCNNSAGNLYIRNTGTGSTSTWLPSGLLQIPAAYSTTTGSAANLFIDAAGGFYRSTSSLKYKTDVQDATHGLAEVMQLRAVTYKGTGEFDGEKVFGGLIAEEVHDAGLTEFVQYAEDGTPDALAYGNMVSLLTKAIQEQQALITQLQADVAALKGA